MTMPFWFRRVVWALGLTMATFSPTRLFSRVDFPELGGPAMATRAKRFPCAVLAGAFLGIRPANGRPPRLELKHPALVCLGNFKGPAAIGKSFPLLGDVAGELGQKARHGAGLAVFGQLQGQLALEVVQLRLPVDLKAPV